MIKTHNAVLLFILFLYILALCGCARNAPETASTGLDEPVTDGTSESAPSGTTEPVTVGTAETASTRSAETAAITTSETSAVTSSETSAVALSETAAVTSSETSAVTSSETAAVASGEIAAALAETVTAALIYEAVDKAAEMPAMFAPPDDIIGDYYGIFPKDYTDAAFMMSVDSLLADEAVIILAVDESAAERLLALLKKRLESKADEARGYSPEQFAVIEKCDVTRNGLWVAMFVSPRADLMREAFNGILK